MFRSVWPRRRGLRRPLPSGISMLDIARTLETPGCKLLRDDMHEAVIRGEWHDEEECRKRGVGVSPSTECPICMSY